MEEVIDYSELEQRANNLRQQIAVRRRELAELHDLYYATLRSAKSCKHKASVRVSTWTSQANQPCKDVCQRDTLASSLQ